MFCYLILMELYDYVIMNMKKDESSVVVLKDILS